MLKLLQSIRAYVTSVDIYQLDSFSRVTGPRVHILATWLMQAVPFNDTSCHGNCKHMDGWFNEGSEKKKTDIRTSIILSKTLA